MIHIKTKIIFEKKDEDYLFDFGFGPKYYLCNICDSIRLTIILNGGFSPPNYKCEDCGEISLSPRWITPKKYDEIKKKNKISEFNI